MPFFFIIFSLIRSTFLHSTQALLCFSILVVFFMGIKNSTCAIRAPGSMLQKTLETPMSPMKSGQHIIFASAKTPNFKENIEKTWLLQLPIE